jgi:hypothetical protein
MVVTVLGSVSISVPVYNVVIVTYEGAGGVVVTAGATPGVSMTIVPGWSPVGAIFETVTGPVIWSDPV